MTDLRPEDHLQWHRDLDVLVADDPDLATVVTSYGRPQRWTRPPGFPSLVLLILEQQVSLASAAAAYRRVVHRIGTMSPAALLATTAEQLRADGVSRQKDRYLRSLAKAIQDGVLDLSSLADLTDERVCAELIRLPGIGRWTAEVYLLACLERPDVWPIGDRALQVAVAECLELPTVPSPAEVDRIGQRWRPLRSTAARLLWHGYLQRRGRRETPTERLLTTPW